MAKDAARARREAQGQGGSRNTKEVGARGNTRAKDAKVVRRRRMLETSGRHAQANAQVRKEMARLETLERELASIPPTPPTKVTSIKSRRKINPKQEGKSNWTMGQARSLVYDGYTIAHVIEYTGWGSYWFNDMQEN